MSEVGTGDEAASWPWPAPADDGAAAHLARGMVMPDIALPSTAGATDEDLVNFALLRGSVVVFVYPYMGLPGRADPPGWDGIAGAHGSTAQALGFEGNFRSFAERGVSVFGLSAQALDEQRDCAARLGLSYRLVHDAGFAVADAMRLPWFETGGMRYLRRLTLIFQDGAILRVVYPVHPPDSHARALLATL